MEKHPDHDSFEMKQSAGRRPTNQSSELELKVVWWRTS